MKKEFDPFRKKKLLRLGHAFLHYIPYPFRRTGPTLQRTNTTRE